MISKHGIAGLGAILLAGSAMIGATGASAASDPDKSVKAPAAVAAKASGTTKYCVVSNLTGSRVPRKECRTRADWMARDGFDPLAKK